jgi:hypothetical protein
VEELQRAHAEQARLAGELLVFQEQFKIEHASWLEAWHVQQGAMEELRRQLAEQKALAENAKGAANHIPTREERAAEPEQPLPPLVSAPSSQPPPPPGGGAAVGANTQEPNGDVAKALQLMTGVTALVLAPRQKRTVDEDTSAQAIVNAIERKDMITLNKIADAIYERGQSKRRKNDIVIEILKKPTDVKAAKMAALMQAARQQAPLAIMDIPRELVPPVAPPPPPISQNPRVSRKEGADPVAEPQEQPVQRTSGKIRGPNVRRRGMRAGPSGL